jgi:pyruvate/2-oxoglutarate dehydrogenase complex dihydrolipoamide dehydrogenase (E3) component
MFFPGKGNVDDFIPWCTFTDPELAHAGLTSAEAEAKYGEDAEVWRMDLAHNDPRPRRRRVRGCRRDRHRQGPASSARTSSALPPAS